MTTGALAGFALVFVVSLVTLSSAGAVVVAACKTPLGRLGAMAERRAAEAVAILPIVIAVLAVAVLVVQATLGVDHCVVHDHHAHLCFAHGTQWIERTWVVVSLAIALATFLARGGILVAAYLQGAASVRALRASSTGDGALRVVTSDRAFCFATRSGVFVSSRVWTALPEHERAALVAHELGHLRHGDLGKRVLLELALLFAAPFVGDFVRALWLRSSERMCDAHAARATDPQTVASAMVSMCKLGSARPVTGFAFTPAARELAGRIEAVLAGGPLGERAARRILHAAVVACAAIAIASTAAAEPLHHAFETLLG